MKTNFNYFRIFSLTILASAFLCGCEDDESTYHLQNFEIELTNNHNIRTSNPEKILLEVNKEIGNWGDFGNIIMYYTQGTANGEKIKIIFDAFSATISQYSTLTAYLDDIDADGYSELIVEFSGCDWRFLRIYEFLGSTENDYDFCNLLGEPLISPWQTGTFCTRIIEGSDIKIENGKVVVTRGEDKNYPKAVSAIYRIEKGNAIFESGNELLMLDSLERKRMFLAQGITPYERSIWGEKFRQEILPFIEAFNKHSKPKKK